LAVTLETLGKEYIFITRRKLELKKKHRKKLLTYYA